MNSMEKIIFKEVEQRFHHKSMDDVSDTRSYANMEQTLRKEYHGRFLIELIQNARDAWLSHADDNNSSQGNLRIRLTKDHALLVCNSGVPFTPDILLYSLGKFGESTKAYGEGIGHKGIGFKSLLEVTLCPEIYSRVNDNASFNLAVCYDPDLAFNQIKQKSPQWDEFSQTLPGGQKSQETIRQIPVLRYPMWKTEIPDDVTNAEPMDSSRYSTIVRVPYNEKHKHILELDQDEWLARVRRAMDQITDEMIVLLGTFATVWIEDELADKYTKIERIVLSRDITANATNVIIRRNGETSSSWRLYEQRLPGFSGLEGDQITGVRLSLDNEDQPPKIILPFDHESDAWSGRFFLFFPTKIACHLPFLYNAYFQVDASRKSFSEPDFVKNQQLLNGLADLTEKALRDLIFQAKQGNISLDSFPSLMARSQGEPADPLANNFRKDILKRMKNMAWVPTKPGRSVAETFVYPENLFLSSDADIAQKLPCSFSADYLCRRVCKYFPSKYIDEKGYSFLVFLNEKEAETDVIDFLLLKQLLLPGKLDFYEGTDQPNNAFADLLSMFNLLADRSKTQMDDLYTAICGNKDAKIIPVLGEKSDSTSFIFPPAVRSDQQRIIGKGILVRTSQRKTVADINPPACLDIAMMSNATWTSDQVQGAAYRLGIRDYTTNGVIDTLSSENNYYSEEDNEKILKFLWALLLREDMSHFGLKETKRQAETFSPGSFFWCQPGRQRDITTSSTEQTREKKLTMQSVLTKSGHWRPAAEVAFGRDWAEFFINYRNNYPSENNPVIDQRMEAYNDLEELAPDDNSLLASPQTYYDLISANRSDLSSMFSGDESVAQSNVDNVSDYHHLLLILHLFFLRLGVWEIPPLQAYVNYQSRTENEYDPWRSKLFREQHLEEIDKRSKNSNFNNYSHRKIHIAEDYAFLWSCFDRADHFIRALGRGTSFYSKFRHQIRFCTGCRTHTTRYYDKEQYQNNQPVTPSYFYWLLQYQPWMPIVNPDSVNHYEGEPLRSQDLWWSRDIPEPERLHQSYLRYLPLVKCSDDALIRFLDISILGESVHHTDRLKRTLYRLKKMYSNPEFSDRLSKDNVARQAFIGLHRQLWSELGKCKDPDLIIKATEETGILAEKGSDLTYCSSEDARYDDGQYAGYRREFAGELPFITLNRGQDQEARTMNVPRFEVEIDPEYSVPRDVSPVIVSFIESKLKSIMALMTFYRIGTGSTIELKGDAFKERSQRLRSFQVLQVDELQLKLHVKGTDLHRTIGQGANQTVFLARSRRVQPVLFHDYNGEHWEQRLQVKLAPYLADMLENIAYTDSLTLLLTLEPEEEETYLLEKGISARELSLVARELEHSEKTFLIEQQRWWLAVFNLFEISSPFSDSISQNLSEIIHAHLQSITTLDTALKNCLLQAVDRFDFKENTSADGVLATLERHGYDLQKLDELLKAGGDSGLKIKAARNLLTQWKERFGRKAAYVLYCQGWSEQKAKKASEHWYIPSELAYKIDVPLSSVLTPVIKDLQLAGLHVEPESLAQDDPTGYLAELVSESVADFVSNWKLLYNDEEKQKMIKKNAIEARQMLVPILVALMTMKTEPDYRLREVKSVIDDSLPMLFDSIKPIKTATSQILAEQEQDRMFLLHLLPDHDTIDPMDIVEINQRIDTYLGQSDKPGHLDRVIKALKKSDRNRSDKMIKQIKRLKELNVKVECPAFSENVQQKAAEKIVGDKKWIRKQKVKKPKDLDKLGAIAEDWALASLMAIILDRPGKEQQDEAVRQMASLLDNRYNGPATDKIRAAADVFYAADINDEEKRLDSLTEFMHLSAVSDGYGFDMLGYLPVGPNNQYQAMFVEVKSDNDGRFLVSTNEWCQAKKLAGSYAFMIVLRGKAKSIEPARVLLLPNPSLLVKEDKVTLATDTWEISYPYKNNKLKNVDKSNGGVLDEPIECSFI